MYIAFGDNDQLLVSYKHGSIRIKTEDGSPTLSLLDHHADVKASVGHSGLGTLSTKAPDAPQAKYKINTADAIATGHWYCIEEIPNGTIVSAHRKYEDAQKELNRLNKGE